MLDHNLLSLAGSLAVAERKLDGRCIKLDSFADIEIEWHCLIVHQNIVRDGHHFCLDLKTMT